MRIREATVDDRARVLELAGHFLEATAYGDALAGGYGTEEVFDICLARGVVLVAEVELEEDRTAVVGFLALVMLEHPIATRRYGDELAWWVEPAHRHEGIGPNLLRAAENYTRQNGGYLLRMVAPAGTRVGIFYRLEGYTELETTFFKML